MDTFIKLITSSLRFSHLAGFTFNTNVDDLQCKICRWCFYLFEDQFLVQILGRSVIIFCLNSHLLLVTEIISAAECCVGFLSNSDQLSSSSAEVSVPWKYPDWSLSQALCSYRINCGHQTLHLTMSVTGAVNVWQLAFNLAAHTSLTTSHHTWLKAGRAWKGHLNFKTRALQKREKSKHWNVLRHKTSVGEVELRIRAWRLAFFYQLYICNTTLSLTQNWILMRARGL